MKSFQLKADVTFEAENIDDAFLRLSKYFYELAEEGTDAETLFTTGQIEVRPC
ncbi:MAG: hypothetical protein HZA15_15540 [Nitrospirae bacterium]|nr:hypothetical protein [Nitrospirota bacterium]